MTHTLAFSDTTAAREQAHEDAVIPFRRAISGLHTHYLALASMLALTTLFLYYGAHNLIAYRGAESLIGTFPMALHLVMALSLAVMTVRSILRTRNTEDADINNALRRLPSHFAGLLPYYLGFIGMLHIASGSAPALPSLLLALFVILAMITPCIVTRQTLNKYAFFWRIYAALHNPKTTPPHCADSTPRRLKEATLHAHDATQALDDVTRRTPVFLGIALLAFVSAATVLAMPALYDALVGLRGGSLIHEAIPLFALGYTLGWIAGVGMLCALTLPIDLSGANGVHIDTPQTRFTQMRDAVGNYTGFTGLLFLAWLFHLDFSTLSVSRAVEVAMPFIMVMGGAHLITRAVLHRPLKRMSDAYEWHLKAQDNLRVAQSDTHR